MRRTEKKAVTRAISYTRNIDDTTFTISYQKTMIFVYCMKHHIALSGNVFEPLVRDADYAFAKLNSLMLDMHCNDCLKTIITADASVLGEDGGGYFGFMAKKLHLQLIVVSDEIAKDPDKSTIMSQIDRFYDASLNGRADDAHAVLDDIGAYYGYSKEGVAVC